MSRGMNKKTERYFGENALAIYEWMQSNKHKYKRGITKSIYFSGVVKDHNGELYPSNIPSTNPDAYKYYQLVGRMRDRGYLYFRQEVPNGPRVWSVNEAMLPAGTATYTGVRTPIPMQEQPDPKDKVLEALVRTEGEHAGRAFVEEELKSISLDTAVMKRKGITLELEHPTLYQLYKLGQTLDELIEPEPEPASEPEVVEPEPEVEVEEPLSESAPF